MKTSVRQHIENGTFKNTSSSSTGFGSYQPKWYAFQRFMAKHLCKVMFVNAIITWRIAETGAEKIEPISFSWFWTPFVAFAFADITLHVGDWLWKNRLAAFILYQILLLGLSICAWPILYDVDVHHLHPLRIHLSKKMHMPGQSGFFAILAGLWFIAAVLQVLYVRKHRVRIERGNNDDYSSPAYQSHARY